MDGWTAEDVNQLESRIRSGLRKVEFKVVQKLVATTHKRLDRLESNNFPFFNHVVKILE